MSCGQTYSFLVRRRALINLIAGFLIGFGLTCQFRVLLYTYESPAAKTWVKCTSHGGDLDTTLTDIDVETVQNLERIWNLTKGTSFNSSLLFVGIMTAQKYLDARSLAIHRTWARNVPGRYAFFSSSSARSEFGLPLIQLPTVDDSYPPQKKSFLMLKFMSDFLLDKFEWFIRADDDVYIHSYKLEKFLRSIDSSQIHFIGQAGLGNKEEFGTLGLEPDENFCMGGPGVIMSRAALQTLVPHIQYCLKHLYSTHEDVEIGRCVRKFVGITCTWSYEMQSIFYHNFSGEVDAKNPAFSKVFRDAITLHPIKVSSTMFALHEMYLKEMHQRARLEHTRHHREIRVTSISQNSPEDVQFDPFVLGRSTTLGISLQEVAFERPKSRSELTPHDFIIKSLYSTRSSNPKHQIESHVKTALDANIMDVMDVINKRTTDSQRIIDFKSLYYGYSRVNSRGISYILDLLMVYRRYKGKKQTVPVRRHTYAVQSFSVPLIREVTSGGPDEIVNIIVPLSGRIGPFQRFMQNFLHIYKVDKRITLAVVLFPDAAESEEELQNIKELIRRSAQEDMIVRVAKLGGHFSRAAALQRGATLFDKNSLLLFLDVDMHFTEESILRVRRNTLKSIQVYYPIVFSQFDPKFASGEVNGSALKISNDSGYWRQFGFGIVSLFNQDFQAIGGMNVAIQGWGQEDVDLFDRFVKSNVTVFRAPDQGFIHIYHEIKCSASLTQVKLDMCMGTKLNSLGSTAKLARYARKHNLIS